MFFLTLLIIIDRLENFLSALQLVLVITYKYLKLENIGKSLLIHFIHKLKEFRTYVGHY
jgi:hypothetical protein